MKRLLYWLYLLVKRQLKNPVIVVVLIAMPVAALIITNTASFKEKEPVRVGIVLEDDDKIAIMAIIQFNSTKQNRRKSLSRI